MRDRVLNGRGPSIREHDTRSRHSVEVRLDPPRGEAGPVTARVGELRSSRSGAAEQEVVGDPWVTTRCPGPAGIGMIEFKGDCRSCQAALVCLVDVTNARGNASPVGAAGGLVGARRVNVSLWVRPRRSCTTPGRDDAD
jgi:hypothetical protein